MCAPTISSMYNRMIFIIHKLILFSYISDKSKEETFGAIKSAMANICFHATTLFKLQISVHL